MTAPSAPTWLQLSAAVDAGDGPALAALLRRPDLSAACAGLAWTADADRPDLHRAASGPVLALRNRGWRRVHDGAGAPSDASPTTASSSVRHRELYPQPGRWWGGRITVAARQVVVVETVPADQAPRPLLLGAVGSVAEDGRVVAARGTAGELVRVRSVAADGTERDSVLAFAEDGLLSSIAGCRFELGMHLDTTITADGLIVDRPWRPGAAAYRLPRLAAAVDVPAGAAVRAFVAGLPMPVHRAYAPAGAEPVPAEPIGAPWLAHLIDLEPARATHPDPELPWQLRIEISAASPAQYGGVHLVALPDRTTERFTELTTPASPELLDRAIDAAGDGEIGVGTTARAFVVDHRLRPDPPGTRYQPEVDVGTATPAALYRRAPGESAPAVVFVHGGGWMGGDRGYHYRHMWQLAARGYVTLNVEYRYHPAGHWRQSLGDVKCAVRWLRAHAAQVGADPSRIAIAGQSAGAHLSALTAATPGQLEGDGPWREVSSAVSAAVLFYPPVDLPPILAQWGNGLQAVLTEYFDHELALASPARHVSAVQPPTLTLSGDADSLIALPPLRRYHEALSGAGVANELVVYPGAGHGFDMFDGQWETTTDRFSAFLQKVLGGPAGATR